MLMHGRPLVYRDNALGRWRPVSQGAVRPNRIVAATPPFDQGLSLAQCGDTVRRRRRNLPQLTSITRLIGIVLFEQAYEWQTPATTR